MHKTHLITLFPYGSVTFHRCWQHFLHGEPCWKNGSGTGRQLAKEILAQLRLFLFTKLISGLQQSRIWDNIVRDHDLLDDNVLLFLLRYFGFPFLVVFAKDSRHDAVDHRADYRIWILIVILVVVSGASRSRG